MYYSKQCDHMVQCGRIITAETLVKQVEMYQLATICTKVDGNLARVITTDKYLDTVSRAVEKADTADTVKDGVAAVLQHVMGADWRLALSLSRKDGPLHYGEILFVQHLRHIWQLPTNDNSLF